MRGTVEEDVCLTLEEEWEEPQTKMRNVKDAKQGEWEVEETKHVRTVD